MQKGADLTRSFIKDLWKNVSIDKFLPEVAQQTLSLKSNTVYYSNSFDFYIVNDHYLEKACNEHENV